MADGFVQVPTDSIGKIIDTSELTVNTKTVERQRIVLADPTGAAALAAIENTAPGLTDYGLVTRPIPSPASISHTVAASGTNATSIKASAGRIHLIVVYNNTPAANPYTVFVKAYNIATAPTVGTTPVVATYGVPPGKLVPISITVGAQFSTGIGLSITAGIADADTTAVAANDCVVDVYYV
jgi:hypothetical protein